MADVFDIEIVIRKNGAVLDGFPYVRRLQNAESQSFSVLKTGADGGSYVSIPTVDALPNLNAFLVRTDTAGVLFKFNNAGAINLNAGGLILIIDSVINSGGATNATVNNNTGNIATLSGFCLST